jgi:cardiolipin synthase
VSRRDPASLQATTQPGNLQVCESGGAYAKFRDPMSISPVAAPVAEPSATFRLLAGGPAAYARIFDRIATARRSILVRAFEWRDDATGQALAQALLAAADRGVEVTIVKDHVGAYYEYLEGTNQSLFHKRVELIPRLGTWVLMGWYGRWGSLRQTPSAVAEALRDHPRVHLVAEKRFDHSKLYVFDDETVILGGMGIGDDFRHVNIDFMVEVSGGRAAERLAERYEQGVRFDGERSFDYLLHSFRGRAANGESLADQRLALINQTRERLTIAMAYLGDPAATEALVAAVRRGVRVTLLTAARANVGADLNLYTCATLLRRTGHAENLRIVLHPTMVHAKALVGDGAWATVGSTNFTVLSHGDYEEVDILCRDREFARELERAIEREALAGTPAKLPLPWKPFRLAFEWGVSAYQGRTRARR